MSGVDKKDAGNLDNTLSDIGEFGPYQIISFVLLFIIKVLAGQNFINYMITANTLDYR